MTRIVALGRSTNTGGMADGNNSIVYSDNSGISWTPALYNGGTTKDLFSIRGFDVLYNKVFNRWIAVGNGTNTIAYSTDGANYLTTNISWTTPEFSNARAIACNDSRWIAVGEGTHSIAYSDDGYNWTGITNKTIFSDFGYGIDCVGTTWVAVGKSDDASAHVIACSTDNGITWSDVTKNGGGGSKDIFDVGRDVTSYGTLFVAGGTFDFPSTLNTLAYSYDGINWEGLGIGVLRDGIWRIATNGTRWIAVGANNSSSNNRIAYSDNPTVSNSWVEINDTTFGSFGRGVTWAGGDIWIAVGAMSPKIVRSSNNGLTWTQVVDDDKAFNFLGVGVASNYIHVEPETESETSLISKKMPQKFGYSDSGNSFMLGRRAFSQNIHLSHQINNLSINNSSSSNKLSLIDGITPKPITDGSSGLRLQRLRLSTIGSSSLKLTNTDDTITFKSFDKNLVNNRRSRARSGGARNIKR